MKMLFKILMDINLDFMMCIWLLVFIAWLFKAPVMWR